MDTLFHLDTSSYPELLLGGGLRPMVEICFASQLMYHQERVLAVEMRPVLVRMEDVYKSCYCPLTEPRAAIFLWGRHIQSKFRLDNLHLTARQADTNQVQVIEAVKTLGESVSLLSQGMGTLAQRMTTLETSLKVHLTRAHTRSRSRT